MYISDMVFEITRRCNMRCYHCLRGCSQKVDISHETICNALEEVSRIGCLTITGGEPSLKPEIIKDIYLGLLCRNISVDYFYIVTNAHSMRGRRAFLEVLDSLYGYCDEPDACSLVISQDQYHLSEHRPDMKLYDTEYYDEEKNEYYYRPYIHTEARKSPILNVINEGHAKTYHIGKTDPIKQEPWDIETYDELHVMGENGQVVYISANGRVTSCCDMSYKRIDEESIGDVNTQSLKDIIMSYSSVRDDYEEVAC